MAAVGFPSSMICSSNGNHSDYCGGSITLNDLLNYLLKEEINTKALV